jgi:hypothetical protein
MNKNYDHQIDVKVDDVNLSCASSFYLQTRY